MANKSKLSLVCLFLARLNFTDSSLSSNSELELNLLYGCYRLDEFSRVEEQEEDPLEDPAAHDQEAHDKEVQTDA